MEPNRILPDLQCSLMCEQVRQEANGNFFLIGIISHIAIPKPPVGVAILCVFNRWTAGLGKFQEQVRLMSQRSRVHLNCRMQISITLVCQCFGRLK